MAIKKVRAYCEGFVFETLFYGDWQGELRRWKEEVRLSAGSELQLCIVHGAKIGKIHKSIVS